MVGVSYDDSAPSQRQDKGETKLQALNRRRRNNLDTRRRDPNFMPSQWKRKVKAPLEAPPGAEDKWPSEAVWRSQFRYD